MTGEAGSHRNDLRDATARWLNLRRSGDMTRADEEAFRNWLAEAPEHLASYRRLERQWAFIGTMAQDPEILRAREEDAAFFNRPRKRQRMAIGAAACLLALTTGWTVIDSGLLEGVGVGVGHDPDIPVYRTAHGERTQVRLADGSTVTLDTDSEIRVREMEARRAVELVRGRAHFMVAKDRTRPFSVAAGDKRIEALGTAFDVRMDEGDQVIVTLVEGRVRVDEKALLPWKRHSTEMKPGRQLVAQEGEPWAVASVDVEKETSWRAGQLTFMGDPLSKALSEVNRYAVQRVTFRDGLVPDRNIVGVFKAGDAEGFVTAIELNGLGHVVSRTADRIEVAAIR